MSLDTCTTLLSIGYEVYYNAEHKLALRREKVLTLPEALGGPENTREGHWVLRRAGEYVDNGRYLNDLAEKHNLRLLGDD